MNLPISDTASRGTLFDVIGAPAAPSADNDSAGGSFQTLLGPQQPQSEPAKCCRPDEDAATGAEPQAAAEAAEEAEAKPADDRDQEATTDEVNPAETGTVVVAPSVTLPVLPDVAAVEENTVAGGVSDVAGDAPRASVEPVPAELLGPLPAQKTESVEGELKGEDDLALGLVAEPLDKSESEQPADFTAELTADGDMPLAEVEDSKDSSAGNKDGQQDRNADRAPQTHERHVATAAVEAFGVGPAAEAQAARQEGMSPSPTIQPAEAIQTASAAASAPPGNSQPAVRLPQELLAPATGQPAAAQQPVTVDAARLLHRVARAFTAAQDGGEVRLRLSPPELGALRLEVRVQDGALVARLETETSAARTAIIDNLPALRERLSEQGVRIERFDVDLMHRNPDRPADRQPPEQLPREPLVRERRMPQMAEGIVARKFIPQELDARRLNVVV